MGVLFNDRNFEKIKTEQFVMENKFQILLNEQQKQGRVLKKLVAANEQMVELNKNLCEILTTLVEKLESKNDLKE